MTLPLLGLLLLLSVPGSPTASDAVGPWGEGVQVDWASLHALSLSAPSGLPLLTRSAQGRKELEIAGRVLSPGIPCERSIPTGETDLAEILTCTVKVGQTFLFEVQAEVTPPTELIDLIAQLGGFGGPIVGSPGVLPNASCSSGGQALPSCGISEEGKVSLTFRFTPDEGQVTAPGNPIVVEFTASSPPLKVGILLRLTVVRGEEPPPPGALQAELSVDKGCGADYRIGEPLVISFRVSRDALVTLRLRMPDGPVRVLVNQQVRGGVTHTLRGTVGEPPGTRILLLEARAGDERAEAECEFTGVREGGTVVIVPQIRTDRGCLEEGQNPIYFVGDPITVFFRVDGVSQALVRLLDVLPDGRIRVILQQVIPGHRELSLRGTIEPPLGRETLVLQVFSAQGAVAAEDRCSFTVAGRPAIEVEPQELDFSKVFGPVLVGEAKRLSIRIANIGDADLFVHSITIRGGATSPFNFCGLTFTGFTLQPRESRTIEVCFSPTVGGSFQDEVVIQSNDPNRPTVAVPIRGRAKKETSQIECQATAKLDPSGGIMGRFPSAIVDVEVRITPAHAAPYTLEITDPQGDVAGTFNFMTDVSGVDRQTLKGRGPIGIWTAKVSWEGDADHQGAAGTCQFLFSVAKLDLQIFTLEGVKLSNDEEGERPGEFFIGSQTCVNLDNDDGPSEKDDFDLRDDKVPGEDDLVRMVLRLIGILEGSEQVRLSITKGADKVKLWEKPTKETQVTLPKVYPASELPKPLWIEGIKGSSAPSDVEFKLEPVNFGSNTDQVTMTVVAIEEIRFIGRGNSANDDDTLDEGEYTDIDVSPRTTARLGVRVFPDKRLTGSGTSAKPEGNPRDRVKVKVTLSTPVPHPLDVYLRAFDVDDPSSKAAPVDDESDEQDNRGDVIGSKAGRLTGQDANGIAKLTFFAEEKEKEFEDFQVTRQPGDNFRIAISCDKDFLKELRNKDDEDDKNGDGIVIEIVDKNNEKEILGWVSPVLTVWRRLHVEVDSMGTPPSQAERSGTSTALDSTELTDATKSWKANQLVGFMLNPNTNQTQSFRIVRNTSDTIKVVSYADMKSIANVGDSYRIEFDADDEKIKDVNNPNTGGLAKTFDDAYVAVVRVTNWDNAATPWSYYFNVNRSMAVDYVKANRGIPSEANYWGVYVIGVYEYWDPKYDNDPDNELALTGVTIGEGPTPRSPEYSLIFMETIRDVVKQRGWNASQSQHVVQVIVTHELAHHFELGHLPESHTAIPRKPCVKPESVMWAPCDKEGFSDEDEQAMVNVPLKFAPEHIDKIRSFKGKP